MLEDRDFILGEKKKIGVLVEDPSTGSLTGATATVTIYNPAGTAIVSAASMTALTDYPKTFYYLLTTGSGQTITSAGTYQADYEITYNSEEFIFSQDIVVAATP